MRCASDDDHDKRLYLLTVTIAIATIGLLRVRSVSSSIALGNDCHVVATVHAGCSFEFTLATTACVQATCQETIFTGGNLQKANMAQVRTGRQFREEALPRMPR